VPGTPRNDPPWNGGRQKGHKREAAAAERAAKIQAAMARMPQLIADYRVSVVRRVLRSTRGASAGRHHTAGGFVAPR
jgi:hypothetical protein